MSNIGVTLPSRTAPHPDVIEYGRMADQAGFDSIWTYELYRDPLHILGACAERTSRVQIGTGTPPPRTCPCERYWALETLQG